MRFNTMFLTKQFPKTRNLLFVAVSSTLFATTANSAQVFTTDVIVDGSQCVGMDCSSSESFGSDTIRIKENNLRIHFDDTSATASFPKNDWRITINDSSNGGEEYFSIDDATGGKTPFKIEAGASTHALYIESTGDIGVGTNAPVLEMHIKDGDSPGIRIEQDGSSGWGSQTWDIAGNETNFFIRDVTNSSALPFKILPGADHNVIVIDGNSEVGMGTDKPDSKLHVVGKVLAGPSDAGAPSSQNTIHAYGSDGNTSIAIEETSTTASPRGLLTLKNNGGSYIAMDDTNTGKQWYIVHANASPNDFVIQHSTGGQVLKLSDAGNLNITGTLTTTGTTCGGGCDLVFDESYALESIEEHASAMWENKYLPTVGPTIENEPFNLTEKTGRMLNELEKAHIYIEQLNNSLKEKNGEIVSLKSKIKVMDNKYESLEERLSMLEQK